MHTTHSAHHTQCTPHTTILGPGTTAPWPEQGGIFLSRLRHSVAIGRGRDVGNHLLHLPDHLRALGLGRQHLGGAEGVGDVGEEARNITKTALLFGLAHIAG